MITLNAAKGFSLIEVLIAMIVLTLGVISFATLQGRNATGNAKSQAISQMTRIADSELEKMINLSYADCSNYNGTVVLDGKTYIRNCSVTENATGNYKTIVLAISTDGMNATFEYIKTDSYE